MFLAKSGVSRKATKEGKGRKELCFKENKKAKRVKFVLYNIIFTLFAFLFSLTTFFLKNPFAAFAFSASLREISGCS
ncbi:hypothetical protein CTE07_42250 [Chitinophaga terrae (ex Kim and Jung 2007)]|jgi:hypothetical protein|nr:hypothetical protein CTE07_42250 [Chitinophaga terrae (ex Kim and Jung 2007)]